MGVDVRWANDEKTIILQTFTDPWTLEEHRDSLFMIRDMVKSQSHTVHSIADMHRAQHAPGQLMLNTRVAEGIRQPNSGLLFIVRPSGFVLAIIRASKRFMPGVAATLSFVDSVEEAYAMIRSYEAKQE